MLFDWDKIKQDDLIVLIRSKRQYGGHKRANDSIRKA